MAKKNSDIKWTDREVETIKKNSHLSLAELSELITGHSQVAVRTKRARLGLSKSNKWTEEEEELLKNCCKKSIDEMVTMFPNRSRKAIIKKSLKGYREKLKTPKKMVRRGTGHTFGTWQEPF